MNPNILTEHETIQNERALAFRDRTTPNSKFEIEEAGIEIARRVTNIDTLYSQWQGERWNAVKTERPDLASKILNCRDQIDLQFESWIKGKSVWGKVEKEVEDYFASWSKVPKAFPL